MLPLLLLALPGAASAEEGEEVLVTTEAAPAAASEVVLDHVAVEAFPARDADALLQALPGLHQSAHGGHGKAPQYLLRGFDAVHGADLAVDVDGVPLNEPSHIHGHGYLDVHLLSPRLVTGLALHPGPFRPEQGDLAVAGSASFDLGLAEPGLWVEGGAGTDRSGQAALSYRPAGEGTGSFALAELDAGGGQGTRRWWQQARLGLGREGRLGAARARAWLLALDGRWGSAGVVRADDVEAGRIGWTGAYALPGEGASRRLVAAASVEDSGRRLRGRAQAWGGLRGFSVAQDYTGWLQDPTHGDATRQAQDGGAAGLSAEGSWLPGGPSLALDGGAALRVDRHAQVEEGILADGSPWQRRIDATVGMRDLGAWAGARWRPGRALVLRPGLRVASLHAGLLRRQDDQGQHVEVPAWAWSSAPVLAPRLSLALAPEARLSGFLAAGRGYRSAEARGIEDGDRAPITRADAAEAGLRARPAGSVDLRAATFVTLVDDEIVFDHVAARFLSTGATRRLGVEGVATLRPRPWLGVEAQATWADGRYAEGLLAPATGPVPYAPRLLCALSTTLRELPALGATWTGGLRGWLLGPRPLPGGFRSQATGTADLTLSARRGAWRADLDVDNLLGRRWRDGEFVFASWPDRDQPRSELPALHLTTGDPLALRLSLGRSLL